MKPLFTTFFICLLIGCSSSKIPDNEVMENSVYDAPVKSQVLVRLELTGNYTKEQVKELCEMMVRISSEKPMKYHPCPTHIWIYIYKSKDDFEKDGSSWVAMYGKAGEDDPGQYTYR